MTGCAGCGGPLAPLAHPGRARKWCSGRCRKASYGDPCVDCGKRTSYGSEKARVPTPRCPACASAASIIWPRKAILTAIREWAAEYGDPPAMPDWDAWRSRALHDNPRARRFEDAAGRWPTCTTVVRVFGSWNAAISAAGFAPRAPVGDVINNRRRRQARAAAA